MSVSDPSKEASSASTPASNITLQDKYEQSSGRVFMTGTQALVRMLMFQRLRDQANHLNTAGFVSGYRGSPLGAVDQELWKAHQYLKAHNIVFQPGLNEELAATAVWGTQMVSLDPNAKVDGVFSLWYGKGPGVDRCGDVFKHGNIAGTSANGGVLLVAGDDHACKSSTLPHQSEHAFVAAMIPVLNPAGVREFIEFGLHGFAMSRYSGCWVAFKAISDTIETSSSFEIDPLQLQIKIPDSYPIPPDGFSIRWPDPPLEQENRMQRERMYAVLEYIRVNQLNRVVIDAPNARLGIVTTGKSYLDVMEALQLLGLSHQQAAQLGLRVLKIGVSWPLEPDCIAAFAEGLDEILVVEEKRQLIEYQIKEHLYNAPSRPRVVGKYDETGEWVKVPKSGILLSPNGELTPATIAGVIAQRLAKTMGMAVLPSGVTHFLGACFNPEGFTRPDPTHPQRIPYFCPGCPHNTSTKVPEGSRALAGIGCHYMVMWMNRSTSTFTQMGGEGATWIGEAPFTATNHVFANLGDGTYMHSGSLAIRAAIAAGVNITYKILVNDAVAMTGGQPVEGSSSVAQIVQQVYAEGVREIRLVTDEPDHFRALDGLPSGVPIQHRDELDAVQRELRQHPGVSVIVYAQVCATEKRRRRKRKQMAPVHRHVVINEHVCEGCGDCGKQSNCLAVLPLETELGRKRAIDHSVCNQDFSCLKGFCPSFVTIEGGQLRKPQPTTCAAPTDLPEPVAPDFFMHNRPCKILIAGVGGTGVVTLSALLGMAAHLEHKGVLVMDMAGLAQKGGAVLSHVKIANQPDDLQAARIAAEDVDVLLGCDLMVSASKDALNLLLAKHTHAVVNTDLAPSGAFTQQPDWDAHPDTLLREVQELCGPLDTLEASRLATALTGDSVATNLFLLGYAFQKGWIPLKASSLQRAIEINSAAVAMNQAAFAWGRQAAIDLNKVRQAAGLKPQSTVLFFKPTLRTLDDIVQDRMQRLSAYQNAAYATRYEKFVRTVEAAAAPLDATAKLAREVASALYKLMAYKDEYEVARLFVESDFFSRVAREFEGQNGQPYTLHFHLAPPLLARKDVQGQPRKHAYGPWIVTAFKWLARMRWLRGTTFDVFGYRAERRSERALIEEYMADMRAVLAVLTPENLTLAVQIARLPQDLRGFGHVKAANLHSVRARRVQLLADFHANQMQGKAA